MRTAMAAEMPLHQGARGRASHGTPRWSAPALGLVVAGHLALLASLVALRTAPVPNPVGTLMVSLIQAAPSAKAPATAKPKAPVTPPKAQPVTQPVAQTSRPPAALAAPLLASASQSPVAASEVAKAAPASSALPASTGNPSPSATPAAAPEASASATAPRLDADYLANPAPAYPPLSRRMREEGKVVLHVFVEASGLPGKVDLRTSSGFARLDSSAMAAVSRWKFIPARQGGEAVGAWVLVPVVFSLKG